MGSPRAVVIAMMALTGAVFFFAFLYQDLAVLSLDQLGQAPWGLIVRYIVAMGLAGAVAGALFSGLFGRHGLPGWLLALLGGILATAVTGLLGSFFGLVPDLLTRGWGQTDFVAIGMGLLVVPLSFLDHPVFFPVWLVLILLTHWLTARRRAI